MTTWPSKRGGRDVGAEENCIVRDTHGSREERRKSCKTSIRGGGVFAEFVLEMGERTDSQTGGRAHAAVIVAGVVSEAGGRRKNDRFAALHPAFNDDIGFARNLRAALGPQRMPVASAGGPLIGFALGGQNADSEPLRKSETDAGG